MFILGIFTIIASIINIIYCYYERVENFFWNWPSYGLIAIGMFINHAYATAVMMIIQASISTYGFFIWTRDRKQPLKEKILSLIHDKNAKNHAAPILHTTKLSLRMHVISATSVIAIAGCIYFILGSVNDISRLTDSISFAVPLVGSAQLNYKKVDCWVYFLFGTFLGMLLAYKASNWYNLSTLCLFFVLDLICFIRWLRSMPKQKPS